MAFSRVYSVHHLQGLAAWDRWAYSCMKSRSIGRLYDLEKILSLLMSFNSGRPGAMISLG